MGLLQAPNGSPRKQRAAVVGLTGVEGLISTKIAPGTGGSRRFSYETNKQDFLRNRETMQDFDAKEVGSIER
jgi:hypothetical protein